MTITAIILAHFKEREGNLHRIINDLLRGTVVPQEIIVFVDNPSIHISDDFFRNDLITVIRSSRSFLPIIRFALGSAVNTDYCLFIDDDLTVRERTLENLVNFGSIYPDSVIGLEGSILGQTETPYSNDTSIKRGKSPTRESVDIVIRTYFVPTKLLTLGLQLRIRHPEFPKRSLDDVYLCLGNKYLNNSNNYVIPVNEENDLTELPDGGVGQSLTENHYGNRNMVCRKLMDKYAK